LLSVTSGHVSQGPRLGLYSYYYYYCDYDYFQTNALLQMLATTSGRVGLTADTNATSKRRAVVRFHLVVVAGRVRSSYAGTPSPEDTRLSYAAAAATTAATAAAAAAAAGLTQGPVRETIKQ
jgi:hypothetical protein